MLNMKVFIAALCIMLFPLVVSAEPSPCPKTQPLTFWIGGTGHITGVFVHLRSIPSLEGEILKELPTDTAFTVIGDFACADEYRWWQIRVDELTGWVAEGPIEGGYYIEKDEIEPPVIDNSALIDIWTSGAYNDSEWTSDGLTLAFATTKGVWIYTGDNPEATPRLLVERGQSVNRIAFDPRDSNRLYAVNKDNSLSRWNVASGSVEWVKPFGEPIRDIFFGERGHALAVVIDGKRIDVFTGDGYTTPVTFLSQLSESEFYKSAVFSHDETMIALATNAGRIDIFDFQGQRLRTFAFKSSPDAMAFNLDDRMFAASGQVLDYDNTVGGSGMRLWDIESQTLMGETVYPEDDLTYISEITFLSDDRILTREHFLTAMWMSIREPHLLYDPQVVSESEVSDLLAQEEGNIHYASFKLLPEGEFALTPDESRMVLNYRDQLEVVDTQTGQTIMSRPYEQWESSSNYTISADGRYFATCLGGGSPGGYWIPAIWVFDISGDGPEMTEVTVEWGGEGGVYCGILRFVSTPEGERLVYDIPSDDRTSNLAFWDFTNGEAVIEKHLNAWVTSYNSVMNGNMLVSAVFDQSQPTSFSIYDLSQSGDIAPRIIASDWVLNRQFYGSPKMAFGSETTLAVTGGFDGRDVILYDLTTLSETARVQTPSMVRAVAVSKDDEWIVTSHSDGIIRLWNVNRPETPIILGQVAEVPITLMFSADQQRVYGSGYVWDVSNVIGE